MNTASWRTYFAGLGVYAVCITIAALPIFSSSSLDLHALLTLCAAATVASLLVAVFHYSRTARYLRDSAGVFLQALLGIAICNGLYSLVSGEPRPEVMFMVFLLWTAVGLMQLNPWRVAALYVLHLGIFLNAFSSSLFLFTGSQIHAEALFMLLASTLMAGFMCWRVSDYARVRGEKARLRAENAQQAVEIEEAQQRIHKLTSQDMDTIALKYPFFKDELQRCKAEADRSGGTFSVGLIGIDHFDALTERHGEAVMKQVLRTVTERAGGVVSKMDFGQGKGDRPLGKVGDGLFGIILPGVNLEGAQVCAQHLHNAIEFQSIRTLAGLLNVTLTIGFAEYHPGESVDEIMELVGRSLEKARFAEVQAQQAAATPRAAPPAPIRAARNSQELRLLHEREYKSPVH